MIAYKLLRKGKNGTLGSLFINRRAVIPLDTWLRAEKHPTKGFKVREGWHTLAKPKAPHLSMKERVWCKVDIQYFDIIDRPKHQGGRWYIADKMKVIGEI